MRSLEELIKADPQTLTKEEASYLQKYRELKRYRHSNSFVYHRRKIPKESDGQ